MAISVCGGLVVEVVVEVRLPVIKPSNFACGGNVIIMHYRQGCELVT